ncbi:PIN/TRAM domain-containing protein [Paenibacillus bovis]|uniref:TRAM domain-containing protein n=1 Tax=Paenibacillus bovis TaxID=1616788 RepID=A0A172ZMR2_9BACL|nr:PIN domain-containing protein [Paenibacillus bovis]ANF98410.1 hypothetical protein AR543_22075 [Paenibacillus bovis]
MLEQWREWGNGLLQGGQFTGKMAVDGIMMLIIAFLLIWFCRNLMMRLPQSRRSKAEPLSVIQLIIIAAGLLAGWVAGAVGALIFSWWGQGYEIIRSLFMLAFGYAGLRLSYEYAIEMTSWTNRKMDSDSAAVGSVERLVEQSPTNTISPKIMDTNIIIDGRIEHIIQAGFLEGQLLVPDFVLHELQLLADAADLLRRERGKRGLDMLNRLRQLEQLDILYTNLPEAMSADDKLVQLARNHNAVLLTNDTNLQKISELHQIRVLNVNHLASMLKQQLIAGQLLVVSVTKAGKEQGQGVAYLDDGTMIVVEQGREHMGRAIEVIVTSALQTANGKMVFAKPYISN